MRKKSQPITSTVLPSTATSPLFDDPAVTKWYPNKGAQTQIFTTRATEILATGAKGWGKSIAGIMWLISGNTDQPYFDKDGNEIPVNISYIKHPGYRALVLRPTYKDLADWITEAKSIYEPMGASFSGDPLQIKWPSGAVFYLGHLEGDSWRNYLGYNCQRALIEEAILLRSEYPYSMLRATVRSKYPELRAQLLLTINPKGPGIRWIYNRFMLDQGGGPVKYGEIQTRYSIDPENGDRLETTLIALFGKLSDNPYQNTPQYRALLSDLPERERRVYLMGEWDMGIGGYFEWFRPEGPREGEPDNARHVIEPDESVIKPWGRLVLGMDWGFRHNSVSVLFYQSPDGRLFVLNALRINQVAAKEYGILTAQMALPWMGKVQGVVYAFLGKDCWHVESEVAMESVRIAEGFELVVGRGRVIVQGSDKDVDKVAREGTIQLRKAWDSRGAGAMYLHELMRFKELSVAPEDINNPIVMEQLKKIYGNNRADAISLVSKQMAKEKLPRLQIWNVPGTKNLINAIKDAQVNNDEGKEDQYENKHWEGADDIDAVRYGAASIRLIPLEPTPMQTLEEDLERARAQGAGPEQLALMWSLRQKQLKSTTTKSAIYIGRRKLRVM